MRRRCAPRASRRRSNSCAKVRSRSISKRLSHRSMCASGRAAKPVTQPVTRSVTRSVSVTVRRIPEMGMDEEGAAMIANVAEMRVIVDNTGDDSGNAEQQRADELRILEALLFAAGEPLDEKALAGRLPAGADVRALLQELQKEYTQRGVNLVRVGGKWCFRTAGDLAWLLTRETVVTKKLSRAAIETLAIVAYHQPVTRAEIEDIRGVTTSKGTLDVLLETGWIRLRGRRKAPGRPVTYGTTEAFMSHFGLEALADLPGLDELKGAGLIEAAIPAGFSVPLPSDDPALREDEDPLEPGDLDLGLVTPSDRTEQ